MAQRHPEQRIRESRFKVRTQEKNRPAIGAPNKGTAKGKCKQITQKQLRERRLPPFDLKRPILIWRSMHIQASPEQERDDLVHFLRQVHRTENRKVTEKVAMTEVQNAHQHLLVKVRNGKGTDYLVQTSTKEVAKGEIHVIIGMFPNVQNSKFQVDADSETSVHASTQQIFVVGKKHQHRLLFTFHGMMNDRCNEEGRISRTTKPNTECDFIISRTNVFLQGKFWDLHLASSKLDLKISEIQTLQHSRKELLDGL